MGAGGSGSASGSGSGPGSGSGSGSHASGDAHAAGGSGAAENSSSAGGSASQGSSSSLGGDNRWPKGPRRLPTPGPAKPPLTGIDPITGLPWSKLHAHGAIDPVTGLAWTVLGSHKQMGWGDLHRQLPPEELAALVKEAHERKEREARERGLAQVARPSPPGVIEQVSLVERAAREAVRGPLIEVRERAGEQALAAARQRQEDRARVELESPPPSITTQMKKKIATDVAAAVLERDEPNAVNVLHQTLKTGIEVITTRQLSRALVRELTTSLTESLGSSLTRDLSDKLGKTTTRGATKELVRFMTPALTHSLAYTVTHALTRPPALDYSCWYCRERQIYCALCAESMTNDYYMDVYLTYYAQFYASYFAAHYSGGPSSIADRFVNDEIAPELAGQGSEVSRPPKGADAAG